MSEEKQIPKRCDQCGREYLYPRWLYCQLCSPKAAGPSPLGEGSNSSSQGSPSPSPSSGALEAFIVEVIKDKPDMAALEIAGEAWLTVIRRLRSSPGAVDLREAVDRLEAVYLDDSGERELPEVVARDFATVRSALSRPVPAPQAPGAPPSKVGFYWWREKESAPWEPARTWIDYDGKLTFFTTADSQSNKPLDYGQWGPEILAFPQAPGAVDLEAIEEWHRTQIPSPMSLATYRFRVMAQVEALIAEIRRLRSLRPVPGPKGVDLDAIAGEMEAYARMRGFDEDAGDNLRGWAVRLRALRPVPAPEGVVEALRPFAKFAEALPQFKGTMPQTGGFYTLHAKGGPVTLTVEDFHNAAKALAALQPVPQEGREQRFCYSCGLTWENHVEGGYAIGRDGNKCRAFVLIPKPPAEPQGSPPEVASEDRCEVCSGKPWEGLTKSYGGKCPSCGASGPGREGREWWLMVENETGHVACAWKEAPKGVHSVPMSGCRHVRVREVLGDAGSSPRAGGEA